MAREQLQKTVERVDVETALEDLCRILNYDFSPKNAPVPEREFYLRLYLAKQGLNTAKGLPKAGAMVAEVKSLIDPIVEARTAKKPFIGLEENLAEAVEEVATWKLERNIEGGQLGNRWEVRYGYKGDTLKNFLIGLAGSLLVNNAMDKLRRCKECRKYIQYKAGQVKEFCNGNCRNNYNNRQNLLGGRLRNRVRQLAKFAVIDDYDINDSYRRRIDEWIGEGEFRYLRRELAKLNGQADDAIDMFLERLPEGMKKRMGTPRQRTVQGRVSRGKQAGSTKKGRG